jgi:hypothetical protein
VQVKLLQNMSGNGAECEGAAWCKPRGAVNAGSILQAAVHSEGMQCDASLHGDMAQ